MPKLELQAELALQAAVLDIDRFTEPHGWDQPAQLFALVSTKDFIKAEPKLAEELAITERDSYTCVAQDGFHGGADLAEALARISWPDSVQGCAIALERWVYLNDDNLDSAELHEENRRDIRLIVGVLRSGESFGVARIKIEQDLVQATNLVPGLNEALLATFN